jgi:hypothetical protein
MDGWDLSLPADVSLDELADDVRDLVTRSVFSQAVDLLRSPRTSRQLAEALGLDRASIDAVLDGLLTAGLVDEVPGDGTSAAGAAGTAVFCLHTSLIALHSQAHESCDQALAGAAGWLTTVHSGEARHRNREVIVERLVRPADHTVDLDVLVAELRSAVASHTSNVAGVAGSAPAVSEQADTSFGAELEVQIVVVRRDLGRHGQEPVARAR